MRGQSGLQKRLRVEASRMFWGLLWCWQKGERGKEGSRRKRGERRRIKGKEYQEQKERARKKVSAGGWSDQHSTWELARQSVADIQGEFKSHRTESQGYVEIQLTKDHNLCSQIFHNNLNLLWARPSNLPQRTGQRNRNRMLMARFMLKNPQCCGSSTQSLCHCEANPLQAQAQETDFQQWSTLVAQHIFRKGPGD